MLWPGARPPSYLQERFDGCHRVEQDGQSEGVKGNHGDHEQIWGGKRGQLPSLHLQQREA